MDDEILTLVYVRSFREEVITQELQSKGISPYIQGIILKHLRKIDYVKPLCESIDFNEERVIIDMGIKYNGAQVFGLGEQDPVEEFMEFIKPLWAYMCPRDFGSFEPEKFDYKEIIWRLSMALCCLHNPASPYSSPRKLREYEENECRKFVPAIAKATIYGGGTDGGLTYRDFRLSYKYPYMIYGALVRNITGIVKATLHIDNWLTRGKKKVIAGDISSKNYIFWDLRKSPIVNFNNTYTFNVIINYVKRVDYAQVYMLYTDLSLFNPRVYI